MVISFDVTLPACDGHDTLLLAKFTLAQPSALKTRSALGKLHLPPTTVFLCLKTTSLVRWSPIPVCGIFPKS